MKKLIFLGLLLFLATTFSSNPSPPGWYQQTLPVDDFVNDIFFLDSLNGWVVTDHQGGSDTSYIMRTTNGGSNWEIEYRTFVQFTAIQFVDSDVGYACGIGAGPELFKTTNGGVNWEILNVLTSTWKSNLYFINKDTGWICSTDPFDGGLFKTTNGGLNWQRQLNETYKPSVVFFINKDTGWAASNIKADSNNLFRTINGGLNWEIQFTFPQQINDILFFNSNNGIITSGINYRTTNGGFNWIQSQTNNGGRKLSFGNDSSGWAGGDLFFIVKTTTGGRDWYYQSTPTANNFSVSAVDSLKAWAGGISLIHTTNGGDTLTSINQIGNLNPTGFILYQNYPNPFNPTTIISYMLRIPSYVVLEIFNINGKEVRTLVSQKQNEGEYEINFDGSDMTSGVYFYKLEIIDKKSNQFFSDTKKMILIR